MTQSSIYRVQPATDIERIELELTSSCNLKCPLCIRSIMPELPAASFRESSEIIEQLAQYPNLRFVTIAGAIAEPTTHPDLLTIIKYLKSRAIEISLYINGDTRTDLYYTKLGVLFRNTQSNIYFTMCGSTQELHQQYRVNSDLNRVLRRLEIVNKFSGNRGILTWIVFNYNEQDFEDNYHLYKSKYRTEFFYTLPMAEHFELNSSIKLPAALSKLYTQHVNRSDFSNVSCPANKNNFIQITYTGEVFPCSLYRFYGESHCFECSANNLNVLRNNKIFNVAEPESEDSEIGLRLYYDRS